jgi:YbbR domain-containing protein
MIAFLRDIFFKDFWLKLFSLVLAVLIWLTISFAIQKQFAPLPSLVARGGQRTFFSVPVAVVSSAEDTRDFKIIPGEVDVTVEGDAKVLETLQSREIRLMVDLSRISSAQGLRKRIEYSTPAGITQVRIMPPDVQIVMPSKS